MTADKLLLYLAMLSVLVILHEYGHFILARRNGVRVTDFALGMGPTLAKWTSPRSGTIYRLNAFPIGGYCQMKGEDGKTNEAEQQREFRNGAVVHDHDNFQAKTPLQRLAIVLGGPAANFIVALVLLVAGGLIFGIPGRTPSTVIQQLQPAMPAQQAGLRPGDRITAIDGVGIVDGNALVDLIHRSAGKPLHVTYVRDGHVAQVTAVPKLSPGPDGKTEGHLGFVPLTQPERASFGDVMDWSWRNFAGITTSTFGALGALVSHPAAVAGQLQGPVGMAKAAGQAAELGPLWFITLAALISVNLGIFNLLPIPALDGGRGVFILVEMLRGKPVDPEKEALVHFGGFAVLIALMIAVSFHDVVRWKAGTGLF